MRENIEPTHGSSVPRAEIPANCTLRVHDIYADENACK